MPHPTVAQSRDEPKKFTLRHRVLRVAEFDGRHRFVLFGLPTPRIPVVSRYTDLLDRELDLRAKEARWKGRQQSAGKPATGQDKPGRVAAPAGRPQAPAVAPASPPAPDVDYYLLADRRDRPSVDQMVATLAEYDVISFDVFDTALFRTVEFPNDVFRVMGTRLGIDGFTRLRKNAEGHARLESLRHKGSREVTLGEIYEVMEQRYAADPAWAELEKALEIEMSRPNPYILEVFERLRALGKRFVFMSDMYLPRDLIEEMLDKHGYGGFEKVYLSNEYLRRKGDGTMQKLVLDNYGGQSIVHVGDVMESDVVKSRRAGLPAVHSPDSRSLVREPDMGSLAGSFYGAVLNNTIGSGTWSEGLHYTHGFRVGGILALGYCEFLERLAREKSIDKILFCGRDCDVISRVYQESYGAVASAYLDVSRYAIAGVTLDVNFDDYIGRSFFRWFTESDNSKTLEQLLVETGFDYLLAYLEDADIERFLFPSTANRQKIERFFWDHKAVVEEHNRTSVEAAKAYLAAKLGDAERVLVVDIGWNGTSATALRHFFRSEMAERGLEVYGALMCTSRSDQLTDAISSGFISAYVYSPLENMDLTRFMMPGGRHPVRTTDLLHHPLEFMFTETQSTVVGYGFDSDGVAVPLRGNNAPRNADQISEIQRGITDFVRLYQDYSRNHADIRPVSPYVAFNPLKRAIEEDAYSYAVYKDFLYDAAPALFGPETHTERFGDLFGSRGVVPALAAPGERSHLPAEGRVDEAAPRILFISPEMIYAGAPRSLLRMCKVAAAAGYQPIVWTAKAGPFAREFAALDIPVQVVRPGNVRPEKVAKMIRQGVQLVVANTVVTDEYVRAFEGRIPLVWYVREAANLPDFFRSSPARIETLRNSRSICSVSEYAATAISRYTDGPVEVVHNTVEDVSALAAPYTFSSTRKHRFVQLGTVEHRKGYDVLVAAFKSLPADYRSRAELHFAGGFVNSGASFASYLFGQVDGEDDIHFHGLITNEQQKIELLSQMDTVVVASRDESCSLVALEAVMLSKPLIVTENVGAKYLVGEDNGLVVSSGSVSAMREALMSMMDRDAEAMSAMGVASRHTYDERASMDAYSRDLTDLFTRRIAAGVTPAPHQRGSAGSSAEAPTAPIARERDGRLVVSLTSMPSRIPTLSKCIDSLLSQTLQPDEVVLWLSTENFPGHDDDLPAEILERVGERFRIAWVEGDLAPHKKYFYAMQEQPDAVVITVDDDVVYSDQLVASLYAAHLENPHAVICERANLIMFRPNGELRAYDGWVYGCQHLRGTATYQLLPTGIGGVLYPPGAIPAAAFDLAGITETSLFADDLWLKVMATANGYPVWMPRTPAGYQTIEEAQAVGLWRANSFQGQNDAALHRVLAYYDERLGSSQTILDRIRGVRPDGQVVGPGEADLTSLL